MDCLLLLILENKLKKHLLRQKIQCQEIQNGSPVWKSASIDNSYYCIKRCNEQIDRIASIDWRTISIYFESVDQLIVVIAENISKIDIFSNET